MELEEIYRRDLNLLIALKILVEEGSVSRAAQRLNLSQSAMSRVLGRLRELLDDPLFTRNGQALIATEKALAINEQIQLPLEAFRDLLTPSSFDPTTCEQSFVIAASDYAMQTILPFVLPQIYTQAPNISLQFLPLQHDNLFQQLTMERVDMAICRPAIAVEPLRREGLGNVGIACLVSKKHPLAESELTLSDFLSLPHAMIAISDGVKALIDQSLQAYGGLNLKLRTYHLEAALAIIDHAPLVFTVPADLAYLMAERHDLVVKPLPFEFTPFEYSLVWHSRCDSAPAQKWLRSVIKQECIGLIEKRVTDVGLS
ncbi:LysR family transcriptional regulator [Vibrio gallicus]|uniref:LysR family transcriptional regulator n=1 Tax=Vibrio gallicus TaxID=190897 RepID=UPI0021C347AB|nr:LysR family transcriptional regulator [Vibrio gallicus]